MNALTQNSLHASATELILQEIFFKHLFRHTLDKMVKDNIKRANKKPGEPGAKPSPSLFARFRPIVSASIILLTAFYVYVSPAYVWRVGETFNVANVE